jgi:hypothetical protein
LTFCPNFTIRECINNLIWSGQNSSNVFNRAKIVYPIRSNPQGAPIQDEATDWCDVGFGVIGVVGRANSEPYPQLDRRETAERTHLIARFAF